MQAFNITVRFVAVLIFLAGVYLFMPLSLFAADDTLRKRNLCLDLKNQDFTQIMESIAEQAKISIKIQGYIPPGKRDLQLKQVPVDKAVEQVMRLYGIQNHAVSFNTSGSNLKLAMFGVPANSILSNQTTEHSSEIVLKDGEQHAVVDRLEQLRGKSEMVLAKMNDNGSLTSEQLQRLNKQNIYFLNDTSRSLTPDQLHQLRTQIVQFEAEVKYPRHLAQD